MSKKKITAPLSYDPGKGRPKEFLAYLNWNEMQALQRLNGGNMEFGPRGLPSFPPADAVGSGQTPGTGNWTGAPGGTSVGSGPGGDVGSRTESGNISGGTAQTSAASSTSTSTTSAASQNTTDTAAQQTAAINDAANAARNSALAEDAKKSGINSINVGPMRTPVQIGGGQVFGSLSRVASATYTPSTAALGAVTRGPGSVSGMIPGNNDPAAQVQSLYGVTNSLNDTLGTSYSPSDVSRMVKAIAGEAAGENPFGKAAVANTMLNRISLAQTDPQTYGYMGGTDPNKLLGQYDATGMRPGTTPNRVYTSTRPGTSNYQAGLSALNQAMYSQSEFSQTASPRVLSATHYYNPDTSNPRWGTRSGREFETVGRHVFGNAEPTEGAVMASRFSVTPTSGTAATDFEEVESSYNPSVVPDPVAAATFGALTRLPSILSGFSIPSIPEASWAQKAALAAMPGGMRQQVVNKAVADAVQNSGFSLGKTVSAGISALNRMAPQTTSVAGKPYQERLITTNGITTEVTPEQIAGLDPADQERINIAQQTPRYTIDPNGIIPSDYEGVAGAETEDVGIPSERTDFVLREDEQNYTKYVSPERQALIADQERKNRVGVKVIERAPFVGGIASIGEGLTKLFTGEDIADRSTKMKYAFEQMSPEQQAEAMRKYPDMRRYAVSAGIIPPSTGSQYASSGTPERELGGKNYDQLYASYTPQYSQQYQYSPERVATTDNSLARKYRRWDKGIGIPSPGDPDYNEYRDYIRLKGSSAEV